MGINDMAGSGVALDSGAALTLLIIGVIIWALYRWDKGNWQ